MESYLVIGSGGELTGSGVVSATIEEAGGVNNFAGTVNPTMGDRFDFLSIGWAIDFSAANVEVRGLMAGFEYDVMMGEGDLQLVALSDGVFISPLLSGDLNADGLLDLLDVNLLRDSVIARDHPVDFDLTDDQLVNRDDLAVWVRDLKSTYFGDANLDGEFNSGDMVVVFTAGKYETGSPAVWEEGDWNADGTFGSDDLVAAFVDGGYEQGPKAASQTVPEPTGIGWLLFAVIVFRSRNDRYLMIRSCMSYRDSITAG